MTAAAALVGCGDLDDVTTVHDLRVLAVQTEPAGFLVDLANPGATNPADLAVTIKALVVDPAGIGTELVTTATACPDYVDTITGATGQGTKLCPAPDATSSLPEPFKTALTSVAFVPDSNPHRTGPIAGEPTDYEPAVSWTGFTPQQLGLFFSPTPIDNGVLDQSIAYNRDFGLDAIVNLTFAHMDRSVLAIKRVVYWPRLAADQVPNRNPTLSELRLFHARNEETGDPEVPWLDSDVFSIGAKDKLYVQPVPAADAIERYTIRVRNTQTGDIETRTDQKELLTYQFFASAGTFTPAQRESELPPIFMPMPGGKVQTDSQWNPPDAESIPAEGGTIGIWVVVRDERAGSSWARASFKIAR